MAHVNGNRYRSFGQGARREKEKEQYSTDNNKTEEGDNEASDAPGLSGLEGKMTVGKNSKTGKYHAYSHDDKETTKHQNVSEMLDHMGEHFGHGDDDTGAADESEESMASEEGLGSLDGSVKSLLG